MRMRSVLAALGAALMAGGCALSGTTRTTVAQVERQLDQALPVGSTRSEVEAWLEGERIESSYKERPDANYSSVVNESVPDIGVYKGVTAAIIRDTDRSMFVSGSIQLYFLYGPDDRLAKRIVRWVGTGP